MKRTIKIGILVSEFPPISLGGTEIATQQLAERLSKRKFEVHVITRNIRFELEGKKRTLKKREFVNGVHIHRVSCSGLPIFRFITHFLLGLFTTVKIKLDIIHGQQITQNGLIAVVAAKLLRRKSIVWGRGSEIYDSSLFYRSSIGNFSISYSSVALAISNQMQKFMKQIWPQKRILRVYNGVDLEKYYRDLKPKSTIEIIFIGRLIKIKKVSDTLQALSHFKDSKPRVKLTIVGSGPQERFLKSLCHKFGIEDNVKFMGKVKHEKIPQLLSKADLFLFPSQREGLPLVILEAMASGLPILASRSLGVMELVQDQINGVLYSPGDISQLVEKMETLIQDEKLRGTMGEKSRQLAKEFSWERIIDDLVQVYHSLFANT